MINFKKITKILLDIKENDPVCYSLFFDHEQQLNVVLEKSKIIEDIFKNLHSSFIWLDSYVYKHTIVYFRDYVIGDNLSKKQNYYGNKKYVIIEDLINNKNIFDFTKEVMTEEEMFYLKLKEIIWQYNNDIIK